MLWLLLFNVAVKVTVILGQTETQVSMQHWRIKPWMWSRHKKININWKTTLRKRTTKNTEDVDYWTPNNLNNLNSLTTVKAKCSQCKEDNWYVSDIWQFCSVLRRLSQSLMLLHMADQPGGEVCGTEIDEKIPLPVQHGEQVLHAA